MHKYSKSIWGVVMFLLKHYNTPYRSVNIQLKRSRHFKDENNMQTELEQSGIHIWEGCENEYFEVTYDHRFSKQSL